MPGCSPDGITRRWVFGRGRSRAEATRLHGDRKLRCHPCLIVLDGASGFAKAILGRQEGDLCHLLIGVHMTQCAPERSIIAIARRHVLPVIALGH